ncbi:MAG: Hint domain-containing protein, partial [Pseudomonadota bacterium]
GALAPGVPERDLVVSPNHALLVTGAQTQLHFAEREVFVAAKHLVGNEGISRQGAARVRYYHLLFESHEVILSNGAWSESFLPGSFALSSVKPSTKRKLQRLLPDLVHPRSRRRMAPARRALKAHEARLLRA